ncbi:aminoglycoside phosphotransferase family protein [Actinoplanes sichuanensis]|uniref:Aminoglycoside phosphotransferase family protein n=1 Tax=Actinoplanes sichuanensis TaxID=512349 RepID=A0ABW4AQW2_9ACTN|nr:aminoglycoside phosphotransferase family protein [Actinoplanes sichuanensis]BEL05011.1 aminoglycoside phosphotransferase family protein [Actinoplanes sichuanensis]
MPDTEVTRLHDDEFDIDTALVRRLLADQFPDWAALPIRYVAASGTDNVTFRVGDDLSVRLPRTPRTTGQVEKDLMWLPRLAPHLPLAIPEPVALGAATSEYPFTWGVYRWLPGTTFDLARLDDPQAAAHRLADFLHHLQRIDTTGAPTPPHDPFSRGTPLAPRDRLYRDAVDQLRADLDPDLLLAAWEHALTADTWTGPPRWIHGDLMAGNLLTTDGRLTAVIDFGTAWAADPAADILPAWHLFEGDSRQAFRDALKPDEHAWVRARGWALSLAVIALPYYRDRCTPAEVQDDIAYINGILAEFTAERTPHSSRPDRRNR